MSQFRRSFTVAALTLLAFTGVSPVQAQQSATSLSGAGASTTTSAPEASTAGTAGTVSAQLPENPNQPPLVKPLAGVKSYINNGRGADYDNPKGMRVKAKTEYFAGGVHRSGWGGFWQGVVNSTGYSELNAGRNKDTPGDSSVTLVHPTLYDDGTLKQTGQLRQYFPVSDFSQKYTTYQTAYYSNTFYKLPRGNDLFNQLIPRYFTEPDRTASHTSFYIEDRTNVSRKVATWAAVGAGQYTQMEQHFDTPTGWTVEAYPYADFILGSNSLISARYYFPIFTQNSVYDAPRLTSLHESRGELFVQIAL